MPKFSVLPGSILEDLVDEGGLTEGGLERTEEDRPVVTQRLNKLLKRSTYSERNRRAVLLVIAFLSEFALQRILEKVISHS